MSIVRLGELQRVYRARQKSRHRVDLRKYLRDHAEPSAAAYQTVSRRLCAKGAIDNLELADAWVGTASLPERAALFYATDHPEAGKVVARLIEASGFSPVNVGGIDKSIRIEVGGDLHEFGKLGKLVSAKEAESLV